MATKPTRAVQDIMTDGWRMVKAAVKHLPAVTKASRGSVKPLTKTGLAAHQSKLKKLAKAAAGQTVAKKTRKTGTEREMDLCNELRDQLVQIRGDVTIAYPRDRDLGRAFGVGAKFSTTSPKELLAIADAVLDAYEDPEDPESAQRKRKAAEAGVTSKEMSALARSRDALADADVAQIVRKDTGKTKTVDLGTLTSEVKAETARIRKVLKHVFRGKKDVLATVAGVKRRTPVKRAKKAKTTERKRATPIPAPEDDSAAK